MPAPAKSATTSKDATKTTKPNTSQNAPVPNDNAESSAASKPDQAAYNAEQAQIKKEIDDLQGQANAIKDKIALTSKSGPNADRRNALKAQLDELRGQQGDAKSSRSKLFEQIKALQESTQKRVEDLRASRSKLTYKSSAEIDAQIKKLESQIESGNMKIVDERRAINDITQLKRQRRTTEGFQPEQDAIDADRLKIDELRKQLDDPETKASSDKFDAIKAELDELRKESDDAFASRNQLYDSRNEVQAKLDALYARKRDSAQKYREASDRYYAKLSEDKARRAERAKLSRVAAEEEKKREIAERLLEEAEVPAYQAEIEDCQTLIDYFSGNQTASSSGLDLTSAELVGVSKLELRTVEDAVGDGLVARKKKGEDEENYFVGGKGKKKAKTNGASAPAPTTAKFSVPFAKLSALMQLSIPPPATGADVAQTIENLKTKKEWFVANQAKQTAVNRAKAEKEIAALTKGKGLTPAEDGIPADDVSGGPTEASSPAPAAQEIEAS